MIERAMTHGAVVEAMVIVDGRGAGTGSFTKDDAAGLWVVEDEGSVMTSVASERVRSSSN